MDRATFSERWGKEFDLVRPRQEGNRNITQGKDEQTNHRVKCAGYRGTLM